MSFNPLMWLQLQLLTLFTLLAGLIAGIPIVLLMLKEMATTSDFFRRDYFAPPVEAMDNKHGEHIYFKANGIKFHGVTKGEGPLMLCLHGFPECWYSFRHLLDAFSGSHKVVAIDLRGYGYAILRNTNPTAPKAHALSCSFTNKPSPSWMGSAQYDLETLVQDVREVIRALGYTECVLVSHDWGGLLAWQFALRYPQMVTRFVTMAMPHPQCWRKNFNLAQFSASWYIFFFQLPWLPELFTTRRNHHMTRRGVFTGRAMGCKREGAVLSADIDVYLWASSTPGVTSSAINYYRNVFTRNIMYGLMNPVPKTPLEVPVLSIIPDCDNAILKSTYRGQAKYVKELTELRLTNSSHWVMLDAPREVVAAMCDFLDVPAQQRPKLQSVSPVKAEPCTRATFRNGDLEVGSTDTPLSLSDLAGSETKRHADM